MNTTKTPSPTTTATATSNTVTNQPKEMKRLGLSRVQESTSQVIGTMAQTMPVANFRRDKKANPQGAAQAGPTATNLGPGSKVVIKDRAFRKADISNSTVHNFSEAEFRSAADGPGSKVLSIKDSSFSKADISNSTVHNFTGAEFRSTNAVTIDTSSYEEATISNGSKVSNFGGARFF